MKTYSKTQVINYNKSHVNEFDHHFFALKLLEFFIMKYDIKSILEVGSGTGRAMKYIKDRFPNIKIKGIEYDSQLVKICQDDNLDVIQGDATNINFDDNSFDLVIAQGVLHHIKKHDLAVNEMCRVSSKALFISDANKFGQGPILIRIIKYLLYKLGLNNFVEFLRTKGKMYHWSEGDGIYYSYSLFFNLKTIKSFYNRLNLFGGEQQIGSNLFFSTPNLILWAYND